MNSFIHNLNGDEFKGKTIIPFDNFSNDFVRTVIKMEELLKDDWIVFTTKEGARGTDFKGMSTAHVILLFQP